MSEDIPREGVRCRSALRVSGDIPHKGVRCRGALRVSEDIPRKGVRVQCALRVSAEIPHQGVCLEAPSMRSSKCISTRLQRRILSKHGLSNSCPNVATSPLKVGTTCTSLSRHVHRDFLAQRQSNNKRMMCEILRGLSQGRTAIQLQAYWEHASPPR